MKQNPQPLLMNINNVVPEKVRFGLFEADLKRRVLTKDGLRIKVQEQPFQVLALLLQRPGEVVGRDEIQQRLWPADTYVAFDDGLNTAIKKLRLALGDSADNPLFIETVPRRGYRFLASVATIAAAPSPHPPRNTSRIGDQQAVADRIQSTSPADRKTFRWMTFLAICTLGAAGLALLGLRLAHPERRNSSVAGTTLGLRLTGGKLRAIDPRAHEEYLQARTYWRMRTAEALTKAIDHYNLAIELEPNYAEAYAGLANCYVVLPMLTMVTIDDTRAKAEQAAEKALSLDDSLPLARLADAEVKFYFDWNFPAAEKEFRGAIALDGNDAQAHQWYAEFLSLMGRHAEAIAEIHVAQRLDPASMIIHHQAGQIYQAARMYPEALEEYKRALMIQPGFGPTYSVIALAYRRQGRIPEALEAERQANLYWDPGGTAGKDLDRVSEAFRSGGKEGFLRAALEFNKKHPGRPYYFAYDYALLGDNAEALKWLQKSLDAHQAEILNLQNDPEFDQLRDDPRFKQIASLVGIPRKEIASK